MPTSRLLSKMKEKLLFDQIITEQPEEEQFLKNQNTTKSIPLYHSNYNIDIFHTSTKPHPIDNLIKSIHERLTLEIKQMEHLSASQNASLDKNGSTNEQGSKTNNCDSFRIPLKYCIESMNDMLSLLDYCLGSDNSIKVFIVHKVIQGLYECSKINIKEKQFWLGQLQGLTDQIEQYEQNNIIGDKLISSNPHKVQTVKNANKDDELFNQFQEANFNLAKKHKSHLDYWKQERFQFIQRKSLLNKYQQRVSQFRSRSNQNRAINSKTLQRQQRSRQSYRQNLQFQQIQMLNSIKQRSKSLKIIQPVNLITEQNIKKRSESFKKAKPQEKLIKINNQQKNDRKGRFLRAVNQNKSPKRLSKGNSLEQKNKLSSTLEKKIQQKSYQLKKQNIILDKKSKRLILSSKQNRALKL